MARPKKLTLDFFVHSSNARNDRRIKALRRRENNDGYATYYIMLEMCCKEPDMKLLMEDPLALEEAVEECNLRDVAHLHKIIETCVNIGLFNSFLWKSERIIFSDELYESYIERLEIRQKTAARKNQSVEAKNIQDKLDQALSIVTCDNSIVTCDNPSDPIFVTCDNDPEFKIQNLKLNSQLKNNIPDKMGDRFNLGKPKNDYFALSENKDFKDWLCKNVLQHLSMWKTKIPTDTDALGYIRKARSDADRALKVDGYFEEFQRIKAISLEVPDGSIRVNHVATPEILEKLKANRERVKQELANG